MPPKSSDDAKRRGLTRIEVETERADERALQFYKKGGFVESGKAWRRSDARRSKFQSSSGGSTDRRVTSGGELSEPQLRQEGLFNPWSPKSNLHTKHKESAWKCEAVLGTRTPPSTMLFLALLLLPLAVAMAVPRALAASPISAQVFPTATTASAGDTIGVAVVVANTGASSAQITSVDLIIPPGWNKTQTGQGPSVVLPGQQGLWSFSVHVSSSTIGSSMLGYNIVAVVNSSVGAAVGSASVQVSPANIALPGGDIPVSLILILIPGVLSIALFAWVSGTKPTVDWRYAVLAFLVGSLGWYLAPWPYGDPSKTNIFTLDLKSGPLVYAIVAVWALALGLAAATLFVVVKSLAPKVEMKLEDQLRITRESQTGTTDTLDYALSRANLKSMKVSTRAMPHVKVTAGSPPYTKSGLLKSFDDRPPYDLLLVQRYEVLITDAQLSKAVTEIMTWRRIPLTRYRIPLNWSLRRKVGKQLKTGLRHASADDLTKLASREQMDVTARIGDWARKKRFKPSGSDLPVLSPMEENEIETLIKGDDVHTIVVDKYVSPYLLKVSVHGRAAPVTLPTEG